MDAYASKFTPESYAKLDKDYTDLQKLTIGGMSLADAAKSL